MDIIRNHKIKKDIHRSQKQHAYSAYNNINEIEMLDEYINRTRINDKPRQKSVRHYGKQIFWCSFFIFICTICVAVMALYYKANTTLEKMSDNHEKYSIMTTVSNITNSRSYEKLTGFDDKRINILLLGRANSHKSGKDLTDTIMIVSINTANYTIGLFSLPRDLLVPSGTFYAKINSLYQTGLRQDVGTKYIIDAVEDITSQKIHYYIVMDFEGFTKLIDTLDGINVDVPYHIKDTQYPGPGYSYETFEVYPGLQKFDGTTALKYARTRHDINGDFGRAKRQQQIMQAARNKAFSLGTIVNPIRINELFTVLGEHIHTNISPNEIEPLISLFKKIDTQNITNIVIDAWKPGSLLISARYYNTDHGTISGLVPRIGSYREIRDRAINLFDLNKIAQREKDIKKESPTITLINASDNEALAARVKDTLTLIGFTDIITVQPSKNTEQKTVVIDNTARGKPFSLDALLKKVPAQKSHESSEDHNRDFVIILGNDIVDIYTYTAISQHELEEENSKNNDK